MFRYIKFITQYLLYVFYFLVSMEVMRGFQISGFASDLLHRRSYLALCILYLSALVVFWILFEAFGIEERRLMDLVYGQFFGALCANLFFAVLLCIVTSVPVQRIWTDFGLLFLLESVVGSIWAVIFFSLFLRRQSRKNALFVFGYREDADALIRQNNRMNGYFQITQSVHFERGTEEILHMIPGHEAVCLGDIPYEIRNRLMKYCIGNGIVCYGIPKISDIYIQNANILRIYDKVLLQYPKGTMTWEQRWIKRSMDILVSLILILATAPLMLLIAAAVKLEDGGPVLYRQDRITRNKKPFRMLKFRSMRIDAEADGIRMASENDPRVTRIGRHIRNLHFDELPQLFNVLKGDMSIVGPRPERMEFTEEYSRIVPEFTERLKVRGGLTGYAQIYGKYNTGPQEKTKYDLMYIYHYSLKLDMKLLFLTFRILFQKENTEGIRENQKNAVR